MRSVLRLMLGLALVATVSAGTGGALPTSAGAQPTSAGAQPTSAGAQPPGQDPFYTYSGSTPLAKLAPGTVLKSRTVEVAIATSTTPVTAAQLLYRTTGELGRPTATVTTVLMPATGKVLPYVVDYLSYYDALGAQCDPSYTLAGGDPGAPNQQQTLAEEATIATYLANDFIVTVPDFEGPNLEWTAGYMAGNGALDAARATNSYLGLPPSTKVGLTGYSGGSIAAEWASELAPRYAPTLNIVGVAEGGIPVDFAHNLDYINGSASWASIIPAVLVALSRAYEIDLTRYLSPYGKELTAQVAQSCIGSLDYPGLTIQKLLKPQYQDFLKIPVFARIIDNLIMGSVPGQPAGPLFMAVGNSDINGDGIMVTADVEGLAHEYCQHGVPLQLTVYSGSDHSQTEPQFETAAASFLQQRFAGVPFLNVCDSVATGNALIPLPILHGYWEVASDGGVFSFGDAGFFSSMGGTHLVSPIVGIAATPDGTGYWEVASDGGIFAFNAPFEGSMGGTHLVSPIVGMAADPSTGGYWEVASDGGIFAFNAPFGGSMGGNLLNSPIVGMAAGLATGSYWEVTSDGGIFSFGGASFQGSMGGTHLVSPIVGMASDPATGGYWEVASDGGIFSFNSPFKGSMGGTHLDRPIVGTEAS